MKKIILLLTILALYQHKDRLQLWLQLWLQPEQANRQGEVVLYATQWCGYCAKTRELLAADRVAYREVDIERDPVGEAAYKALGGNGVPVLDVKGTVIHGYNPQAIRAAY